VDKKRSGGPSSTSKNYEHSKNPKFGTIKWPFTRLRYGKHWFSTKHSKDNLEMCDFFHAILIQNQIENKKLIAAELFE